MPAQSRDNGSAGAISVESIAASHDVVDASGDRYSRHRMMAWWNQSRVSKARVLVAGAGAIGNEVIKLLALMGLHNLTIVDFDKIEISNLTRSPLFRDSDIGKSKALTAATRARELNPESKAIGIDGDLEFDVGLGVYRSMNVVIGCLDSINARLALNRACLHAGTPWLNGGIEDVFGEASLHAGSAACFECGMTEPMWQKRNLRYSCGGQQVSIPADSVPTTAIVASVIAAYLVNEALLLIHSQNEDDKKGMKPGQKIVVSMMPYDFQLVDLTRNPECTSHELWSPVHELKEGPSAITPLDLLNHAESLDGVVELGFDLLTGMTCVECGNTQEIVLPVEKSNSILSICPACGKDTRRPNAISWIDANSSYAEVLLSGLCIQQHQIIAVNTVQNERRYYQVGGDPI